MALARLLSRGQDGLAAYEVSVEVHIAGGLPGLTITGLPTAAVRESRDRVRAALQQSGMPVPASRITVHLGPADIPKDGGRFDLPIALGIIQAAAQSPWQTEQTEFVGELTLGGEIRGVRGVVPAALAARAAGRRLVVPAANAAAAALIPGHTVVAAGHLSEVLDDLNGVAPLPAAAADAAADPAGESRDLDEVAGHAGPKRALTVAAAGGHNLLMVGPPGAGKSMLAERLPTLLPPLSDSEWLEVAAIESVAGRGQVGSTRRRPFRAPHHGTPAPALIGGGALPRPGEVTRAHHGVLFLDELPEFSRRALEALREPLETECVTIARVHRQTRFPAAVQLVAAMNPCPCGYFEDGSDRCECPPSRIRQYRSRVSGPLLDRFDLHIAVERVGLDAFSDAADDASAAIVPRVLAARETQMARNGCLNRRLDGRDLWRAVGADRAARRLLDRAEKRWLLSTRSLVRVLRVARTIADLDSRPAVAAADIAEALQLRRLDRRSPGGAL